MVLTFDDALPRALGFEFTTDTPPATVKRMLELLASSAYDTIGTEYQDLAGYAIYKEMKHRA